MKYSRMLHVLSISKLQKVKYMVIINASFDICSVCIIKIFLIFVTLTNKKFRRSKNFVPILIHLLLIFNSLTRDIFVSYMFYVQKDQIYDYNNKCFLLFRIYNILLK